MLQRRLGDEGPPVRSRLRTLPGTGDARLRGWHMPANCTARRWPIGTAEAVWGRLGRGVHDRDSDRGKWRAHWENAGVAPCPAGPRRAGDVLERMRIGARPRAGRCRL